MDNETELLRVKEKLLGDLSAGLGVVQVVSCESSQKVRSQISHVKLLWKQLSKCFGSLKSIYAANGKDREVRKLTLEKQSLAAKVGAAVLNLNDVLDGMGEDLESSFAGSTTSSLVDGAAGVDLDVGNTTSGDLGKTTPSVIRRAWTLQSFIGGGGRQLRFFSFRSRYPILLPDVIRPLPR